MKKIQKTSPLPSMQLGTLAAAAVREDCVGGGLREGAAGGAAAAGAGAGVGGAGPEEVPRVGDGDPEGGAAVRGAGAQGPAAGAGALMVQKEGMGRIVRSQLISKLLV